MPTLNWIGRDAVINYHNEVPFHLLRCDSELSIGEREAGNLLVKGDNLLALKALLPYYAGQVKCIYIDPPYNTGNESWVYNDAVNSTEMRDWLGRVVGDESEDLSRHDKWLCMMYPRMVLLREMLREDGSLWVSIDDNEVHNARNILDEIFGSNNFIDTIIWQKIFAPKGSARHFSANHDFILVYAKNANIWQRNLQPRTLQQDVRYKNYDNDPRGVWASDNLTARNYYSLGTYSVTTPSGRVIGGPPKGNYWRVSKETFDQLDKDNRIWWGKNGNNMPRLKRFLSDVKEGIVPQTIWPFSEVGHTQEAKQEIVKILPDADTVFSTPKPVRLIQRIIQIATNPGDLILDSFAGSGTTGHAVLAQNALDGGNRRFILVEMEPKIVRNITIERLWRVIQGYEWLDQSNKHHMEQGLGSGFCFCELGLTLFDTEGQIRDEVSFLDLAQHIFFVETGRPFTKPSGELSPLLGVHNGTAVYLLYNGILKDESVDGGNVLTRQVLQGLPGFFGPKVIYGNGCRISDDTLRGYEISFKHIPYDVREK